MARFKVFSGQDVTHILERNGFVEVRRHGSHILMQKRIGPGTITLPVPDHHELKRGTLMGIIRESRVSRSEFEVREE